MAAQATVREPDPRCDFAPAVAVREIAQHLGTPCSDAEQCLPGTARRGAVGLGRQVQLRVIARRRDRDWE